MFNLFISIQMGYGSIQFGVSFSGVAYRNHVADQKKGCLPAVKAREEIILSHRQVGKHHHRGQLNLNLER